MSGQSFFRWFNSNLGSLVLALLLAFVVWVSAVFSADPNEECTAPSAIPLEVRDLGANLLFGDLPETITMRLFAPHSVCQQMADNALSVLAYISLADLEPGSYNLPVTYEISERYSPVRVLGYAPEQVSVTLEAFSSRTLPITLSIIGEPAPGYTEGLAILSDSRVVISGTKTVVDQVARAMVSLDIGNAEDEINVTRVVQLLDEDGKPVSGLEVSPSVVTVRQIIDRPGSFREVIVRVIYIGSPANGYRLTSITPTPQIVTVFSNDPQIIRELPGFLETEPIDLTGATDDIELRRRLVLPDGVFVDGEQTVLVQVGIAAIESSITLNVPVEVIGLLPGLEAGLSPQNVDVILTGPLPILTALQPLDVRVVLDLAGFGVGEFNVEPRIEIIPLGITTESILPGVIEVTVVELPTPTPGPGETPTVTPTPTTGPPL